MCRCRVADRDIWYRTITNQKHIKNNGSLHHAALKAFIDPPVIKTVEWKSEISGRLRSLADDIRADGERRAALQRERSPQLSKYLQFCAVVFTHPAKHGPGPSIELMFCSIRKKMMLPMPTLHSS